ncbi:MAG: DHH family phosphoesterase [candidate division WOR-3 bacterium]
MNIMEFEDPEPQFDIPERLMSVLAEKGADSDVLLDLTLNPSFENLLEPDNLPNMSSLVKSILRSAGRQEKILVWGHEDADGITSVAVMLRTLRHINASAGYYIPSKASEGHGLTSEGIDWARGQGYGLILTVDTGSGDLEMVEYARSMGMDILITDHHELTSSTSGITVVNPKMGGSFKHLAGVGVALKCAWAILSLRNSYTLSDIEREFPELIIYAMIGTLADKVPLFAENKAIADRGRELMSRLSFPFIRAYERIRGVRPTPEAIITAISAGKSSGGKHPGVELLVTTDEATAEDILAELLGEADKWFARAERIYSEFIQKIKRVRGYILLDAGDTEPGYLSYISSKLKNKYDVPAIVMGRKADGRVVAEIRAPWGYDMMDLLSNISHLLSDYGGHKLAAGFTMEEEYLSSLAEELEYYFTSGKGVFDESRGADMVLEASDSETVDLLDSAEQLGKLGVEIRFLIKGTAGDVSSLLGRYNTYDPEALLSIHGKDVRVKALVVSGPDGYTVENLWSEGK